MDIIDSNIIELLKANSRMTTSEISKRVNLSIPAVSERIKKLEESKVIEQYTIKVNRTKLNYKQLAFIMVNIDRTVNPDEFRKEMVEHKNILECHHIAGEHDYILKVLVEDTIAIEDLLREKLNTIKGIIKTTTMMVLSTDKETMNI